MIRSIRTLGASATIVACVGRLLGAQAGMTDLAKASQNPIGSIVSVPLQNNVNFATGTPERSQYLLNIQPVYPMPLSAERILVPRLILPLVNQPIGADQSQFGMGDATLQLFDAIKTPLGIQDYVWGVGPAFIFPTATDKSLGAGKWDVGAAFVGLVMPGNWVTGVLISQLWSVAGDGDRRATAPFTMQPFVNYNLPSGWALISSPIITADWKDPGPDAWLIPAGGGASRTFTWGAQAMTFAVTAYSNVVRTENAPSWTLRMQLTLLYPKH
jgi:hypothetical protein